MSLDNRFTAAVQRRQDIGERAGKVESGGWTETAYTAVPGPISAAVLSAVTLRLRLPPQRGRCGGREGRFCGQFQDPQRGQRKSLRLWSAGETSPFCRIVSDRCNALRVNSHNGEVLHGLFRCNAALYAWGMPGYSKSIAGYSRSAAE